jgi:predicted nucleic acid-binding protein
VIVFLDTNIVIYLTEMPPGFGQRAASRISASKAKGDTFMISDLTRMECRVRPLRASNGPLLAAYDNFFGSTNVQVVGVSAAVCDRATAIRATHRFAAMDSLHLAAAVEDACDVFLTNDARLSRFPNITVEVLP